MDGNDFKAWRAELGFSVAQAARALGVKPRTIQYWEADDAPISAATQIACEAWRFTARVIAIGGAGAFVMVPPVPLAPSANEEEIEA